MPEANAPVIVAAQRAAARTGLIFGLVVLLLGFALNAWVLVNDLHHNRAITLTLAGFVVVVLGLL